MDDTSAPEARHLYRSSTNRVFGGVAAGLGERFAIDANLVRVGFIVVTFLWGLGALIYLALWVLVPRREDESTASLSGETASDDDFHVDADTDAPRDEVTSEAVPLASPRSAGRSRTTRTSASRSSSLPVAVLVAGLVLLAAVILATRHGLPVLGGGLAGFWVLALVLLAFLALRKPGPRRIRRALAILMVALVSVMIVLTGAFAAFLATTGVPLHGGTGSRTWQPLSLSQTRHNYELTFGHVLVDLSAVHFPTSGYVVNASVGVGQLEVIVPAGAVVDLRTHVGAGVSSFPSSTGGFDSSNFLAVPPGLSGAARAHAAHLTLTVQVGVGRVEVVRAG
jgi:phage shock protein PspC (stress-responsive transcriptional regulator)